MLSTLYVVKNEDDNNSELSQTNLGQHVWSLPAGDGRPGLPEGDQQVRLLCCLVSVVRSSGLVHLLLPLILYLLLLLPLLLFLLLYLLLLLPLLLPQGGGNLHLLLLLPPSYCYPYTTSTPLLLPLSYSCTPGWYLPTPAPPASSTMVEEPSSLAGTITMVSNASHE